MPSLTPIDAVDLVETELHHALAGVDEAGLLAVRALLDQTGRRTFVTGQGRSGLVAAMAAMRLMHLGHEAHLVGEATAPSLRSGDLLILLSRSGTTATTVSHARIARAERAHVVVITESPDSALAELADDVLAVPGRDSKQFGGSRFEQAALVLLDALVLSLAPDASAQRGMQHRHTNLH